MKRDSAKKVLCNVKSFSRAAKTLACFFSNSSCTSESNPIQSNPIQFGNVSVFIMKKARQDQKWDVYRPEQTILIVNFGLNDHERAEFVLVS